jgi:P4 family phage/plasmid primase-like protien
MRNDSAVDSALLYAELGFPVVPLHGVRNRECTCRAGQNCQHPGKHPCTPHGVHDATTDREQIVSWFSKWPNANIGIETGSQSGIIVLDIDPRHGGYKTLKQLEQTLGQLPDTPTAWTGGGGVHLFFECPPFKISKDTAGKIFGPGIDLLADGCLIVAPPSHHISGKRYSWESGLSLHKTKPVPLPDAWLRRLRRSSDGHTAVNPVVAKNTGVFLKGERNNRLTSIAGTYRAHGEPLAIILTQLETINATKCKPPLSQAELEGIVRSIAQYPTTIPKVKGDDTAEKLTQLLLDEWFKGGEHLLFCTDGQFWRYNGWKWTIAPRQWLAGRLLMALETLPDRGHQNTASLLSQSLGLLQAKLAVEDDRLGFVSEGPAVINCFNYELRLQNNGYVKPREHRPMSWLRHCLDVKFDPAASCPLYDKAIAQIFADAEDPENMVRHWHEIAGYLIQPRRHIPLILICLGSGSNGKTVLVQTISRLLGNDLVSSQRIENLDRHRFAVTGLLGKLLLIDDDVRAGVRLPDGELKKISEAKPITAERKFGPTFEFVIRSVPVLLCNNIPSLADVSYGMIRRLMVIPFDRTFKEDTDFDLFPTIWKTEMSGVLNRYLQGLRRLMMRGEFYLPAAVKRAKVAWLNQANPLPGFIDENCQRIAQGKCLLQAFYDAYRKWADLRGYTRIQQYQSVRRNLENLGFPTARSNQGLMILGLKLGGELP